MQLAPIDHDPFSAARFEPIEHDPFTEAQRAAETERLLQDRDGVQRDKRDIHQLLQLMQRQFIRDQEEMQRAIALIERQIKAVGHALNTLSEPHELQQTIQLQAEHYQQVLQQAVSAIHQEIQFDRREWRRVATLVQQQMADQRRVAHRRVITMRRDANNNLVADIVDDGNSHRTVTMRREPDNSLTATLRE